ncbi:MAG: hypothetical protein RBT33_03075 [Candidatus Dojkabacteria bacterium]|jgi:hypothetical protein|nr:hypothetical protein [Candidatus Dojkabacteria bacterium]
METENNSSYEISQDEIYRFHFGMELERYILDSQEEGFDPTIFDFPLEFNMPNDRLVVLPLSVRPMNNCIDFTSLFKILESDIKNKGGFIHYDYIQEDRSESGKMYEFLKHYKGYRAR